VTQVRFEYSSGGHKQHTIDNVATKIGRLWTSSTSSTTVTHVQSHKHGKCNMNLTNFR